MQKHWPADTQSLPRSRPQEPTSLCNQDFGSFLGMSGLGDMDTLRIGLRPMAHLRRKVRAEDGHPVHG
jgi:hypothetical protein